MAHKQFLLRSTDYILKGMKRVAVKEGRTTTGQINFVLEKFLKAKHATKSAHRTAR